MNFRTYSKTLTLAALTAAVVVGSFGLSYQADLGAKAFATAQDACGEKFTYEKTSDFNDSRVNIDFTSNNTRISVSADSGYKVNKIWLDVDNDGQSGYVQVATGAINNFNPSGDEINKVKVEVEKECVDTDVCAGGDNAWSTDWYKDQTNPFGVTAAGYTIDQICVKGGQDKKIYNTNGSDGCWSVSGIGTSTASAIKVGSGSSCKDISHASFHRVLTVTLTPTHSVTPTITVTPTYVIPSISITPTDVIPSISVTPTDYVPSVTPTPTCTGQTCIIIDCDGGGTCEVNTGTPSATLTPTSTPSATPSVTDTPSNNPSSSNNVGGVSSSSSPSTGSILGTNTMAPTGNFMNSFSNILMTIGGLLTALPTAKYVKTKKAKKSK